MGPYPCPWRTALGLHSIVIGLAIGVGTRQQRCRTVTVGPLTPVAPTARPHSPRHVDVCACLALRLLIIHVAAVPGQQWHCLSSWLLFDLPGAVCASRLFKAALFAHFAVPNHINMPMASAVQPDVCFALGMWCSLRERPCRLEASHGGVDVQEAMRTAEKLSTDDIEVKMKLVAPPLYVLTTQTLEKARGLELLREACDKCRAIMEERRGKIVVKSEARVVSAQEDKLLDDQLQQLAASNAEVDGDADSEEAEEGMGEVDLSGPGMST